MEALLGFAFLGGMSYLRALAHEEIMHPEEQDEPSGSVQSTEPKYTHRVINGKRTKVLDFT